MANQAIELQDLTFGKMDAASGANPPRFHDIVQHTSVVAELNRPLLLINGDAGSVKDSGLHTLYGLFCARSSPSAAPKCLNHLINV